MQHKNQHIILDKLYWICEILESSKPKRSVTPLCIYIPPPHQPKWLRRWGKHRKYSKFLIYIFLFPWIFIKIPRRWVIVYFRSFVYSFVPFSRKTCTWILKNTYEFFGKHVQVFEKTSSCFWSTNYQSFTKESISKDLLYITTRENRYHTIRIHRIS